MTTEPTSEQQGSIEGTLLRGGTSKGFFVREENLPRLASLDDLLLELFGSPDPLQIDGIGGSNSHTSKFVSVAPSDREGIDVEYTFAQVGVSEPTVDWSRNCGNLTSAVGSFAIREGLLDPSEPTTEATLYNTNTDTIVTQEIPVADGEPAVVGDYRIDGVPGTGAKIASTFHDPAGNETGSVFPSGNPTDSIEVDGEPRSVTIADATNVVAFVRASDVGMDGTERPDEIANSTWIETLEGVRQASADLVGLDSIPLVAVVAEPQSYRCSTGDVVSADEIDLTSRVISLQPHHAYAMTGAMCLAAAARLPGTIPFEQCRDGATDSITIGHPKGTLTIGIEIDGTADPRVASITNYRTARPLFDGRAYYRVGSS